MTRGEKETFRLEHLLFEKSIMYKLQKYEQLFDLATRIHISLPCVNNRYRADYAGVCFIFILFYLFLDRHMLVSLYYIIQSTHITNFDPI